MTDNVFTHLYSLVTGTLEQEPCEFNFVNDIVFHYKKIKKS